MRGAKFCDSSQFFFFNKRLAVRSFRDVTTHMSRFRHDRTCHVFVTVCEREQDQRVKGRKGNSVIQSKRQLARTCTLVRFLTSHLHLQHLLHSPDHLLLPSRTHWPQGEDACWTKMSARRLLPPPESLASVPGFASEPLQGSRVHYQLWHALRLWCLVPMTSYVWHQKMPE